MNFKEYKISDLCDVKIGRTPPTSQREWFNPEKDSIDWVSIKDMGECNKYLYNTCKTLSNTAIERFNIPIVEPWRVLLSFKLTIGKVAITTKKCLTNEAIAQFIIKEKNTLDNDFLYYYLINYNFEQLGNTSSIATAINSKIIKMMPIRIPDFSTQKKIAKILSSLDDKIELNNRINKNLEEQAQALFKSWFVDFEPFGGVMPSDWRYGKVDDIIEIHDSRRKPLSGSQREKMENKKYPYYGATSIMDYVDNYIFEGKYLLLAEDGSVSDDNGYPILQYVWGKFWVNNHAHILTGKKGFNVESLYLLMKNTSIKSIITGAVQPKISQGNLCSLKVLIPSELIMNKFNLIIEPLFKLIRANIENNQILAQLRDTLLPKLMSGEIDVDKVEI